MNIRWSRNDLRRTLIVGLAALLCLPCFMAVAQREPSEKQIRQMLQRFPGADLNKDGTLTPDEFREFRSQTRVRDDAGALRSAEAPPRAPTGRAANGSLAGPVGIHITSDKPVPVNPRVYGIICEEMFVRDLVDDPEYISARTELKFKTFVYPGGSASYYHHPRGTGGFNIRPEEVRKSKHGEESRFMKEGTGPDHFEQYMQFVKASGGEAVFTANILNGTVAELDEFLSRLQAGRVPIAGVVLGVEMHLGQPKALGLDGYVERIKPYIAMLQAKYPQVPIVAHSTPVGRVGDRAKASFQEWNQTLAKLPGIDGFSQYGWPEFGTGVRQAMSAATSQTPGERWQFYDEFARTFPDRQLPAYQQDWGVGKKMYMLQWGTHLDRNTSVQGLHMANFYFFLAQYNAAHDDYFAVATSTPILATTVSKGVQRGGVIYKDKIALLASYFYTKPFRHLFSGDKKLLAASVKEAEGAGVEKTVKALAAAGPDGRTYLYVINSGPARALGGLTLDGEMLAAEVRLHVESAFEDSTSDSSSRVSAPATVQTFTGVKPLRDIMLEPWSLTLPTLPMPGISESIQAETDPNPAFAPVETEEKPTVPTAVETTVIAKPLTDMTAEDRYKGEDGGLYGGGRNSPPEVHLKAALAEAAKIQPLDAEGKPSSIGRIVLLTHGMSNTTMESQRFIEVANTEPRKNPSVILVDGAQGGMDSRKWVEDTRTRSGASPWDRLEQRIKSAEATPLQVQVIWMKHAISLKNDDCIRQFGGFPNYARQLQRDMAQLIDMLKKRYPNLRLVYVSSRSYGGYATTPLNPEPYAYESAFGVRWLIQDQINGVDSLSYTAGTAPLLLWGPYLWADGEKGRKFDDLMYKREDFREDGTHPADSGQQKVAGQLVKFFTTDPTAAPWFLEH